MDHEIKILIADDHTIVRAGIKTLLGFQQGFKVIGEAADGNEAIDVVKRLHPDVAIMDLMMPVMDGIEATRTIIKEHLGTAVIILTTFTQSEGIATALAEGALGALAKTATSTELVAAIRTVAKGEHFISDEIRQMLAEEPPLPALTEKQLDILASVTRGLSNEDIGRLFGISPNSVKKQLKSIFAKLNVATRAEAVALAMRKYLLKI